MSIKDILQKATSGEAPASWVVFVAQKGKASAKALWNYVWAAGFGVFALLGLWFLVGWGSESGIVGILFSLGLIVVFGWLAYGSYKKGRKDQRDAMGGVVILTEDRLVYPDGAATRDILFSDMQNVFLKVIRIQGLPHPEITVETTSGERIIVVEGSQYGEPQQVVNVIRDRARITTSEKMSQSDRNSH